MQVRTVQARKEVVLSAGAIGTPQLLMVSGVGPGDHLRHHGVSAVILRASHSGVSAFTLRASYHGVCAAILRTSHSATPVLSWLNITAF